MGSRRAVLRTPQEKKQLSYAKDHRNNYGENDKSSRKNIPRRKKLVNRANRHRDTQILDDAAGRFDPVVADEVEQKLRGKKRKRWRKAADARLGAHVEGSISQRRDPTPRAEAALRRLRRSRQARQATGNRGRPKSAR